MWAIMHAQILQYFCSRSWSSIHLCHISWHPRPTIESRRKKKFERTRIHFTSKNYERYFVDLASVLCDECVREWVSVCVCDHHKIDNEFSNSHPIHINVARRRHISIFIQCVYKLKQIFVGRSLFFLSSHSHFHRHGEPRLKANQTLISRPFEITHIG